VARHGGVAAIPAGALQPVDAGVATPQLGDERALPDSSGAHQFDHERVGATGAVADARGVPGRRHAACSEAVELSAANAPSSRAAPGVPEAASTAPQECRNHAHGDVP
jgi:hypothetical protein